MGVDRGRDAVLRTDRDSWVLKERAAQGMYSRSLGTRLMDGVVCFLGWRNGGERRHVSRNRRRREEASGVSE